MKTNNSKCLDNLADFKLGPDPMVSFLEWYQEAKMTEENPEAMTLATVDVNGVPDARIVLYKGLNEKGLKLFGRETSAKGRQLEQTPKAALVFYWHRLHRQVRIQGEVELMPRAEVEHYFSSRALESQVASSISNQSYPISSRQELEATFQAALQEARAQGGKVTCPATWQGYVLLPRKFEFFIYREFRLNDRFEFTREADSKKWTWSRLQP